MTSTPSDKAAYRRKEESGWAASGAVIEVSVNPEPLFKVKSGYGA